MSGSLTADQVRRYEQEGYLTALRALGREETARFRACFEEYERSLGDKLDLLPPKDHRLFFTDPHKFLHWAYDLGTRPAVLDAVESLLGPDLLLWSTQFFPKRPRDPTYISWHQDGTYWALDPPKVCTAWIALTRSVEANGCLRVVPGSHTSRLPHHDTFDTDNALTRGQEIAVDVPEEKALSLVLAPGEMSIHHVGTVHGSMANTSDEPRIGFALVFIAPEVRQTVDGPPAMLVRGEDRFGHFSLESPPGELIAAELESRRLAVVAALDRVLLASSDG